MIIPRASSARIRSSPACSTPAPSSASSSRSTPANWQSLQQNLPVTPVTDLRVHRNDLVISTMGRSAWIMDNVTPLQQLAAIAAGTPRAEVDAREWNAVLSGPSASGQTAGAMPATIVFAPREAIRLRNSAAPASPDEPEYPGTTAQIDLYFQNGPSTDTKLEVTDARGQVLRAWSVLSASGAAGGGQEMRGFFRRGPSSSPGIKPEPGMQRPLGSPLPRPVGTQRARGRSRRADGAARQVHHHAHLRWPDDHAHARGEVGSSRGRRWRGRRRHRRAGALPAAGARRHQRRAEAAGEHRGGDEEGGRPARGTGAARHQPRLGEVRPPAAGAVGKGGRYARASTSRACWSAS
jgi:hypothetical protein